MTYNITDSWTLLRTLNDMSQDSVSFTIEHIIEVAHNNIAYLDYACCSVLLSAAIDPEAITANPSAYKKILHLCQPFYNDLLWSDRFRYELIEQILETQN